MNKNNNRKLVTAYIESTTDDLQINSYALYCYYHCQVYNTNRLNDNKIVGLIRSSVVLIQNKWRKNKIGGRRRLRRYRRRWWLLWRWQKCRQMYCKSKPTDSELPVFIKTHIEKETKNNHYEPIIYINVLTKL